MLGSLQCRFTRQERLIIATFLMLVLLGWAVQAYRTNNSAGNIVPERQKP